MPESAAHEKPPTHDEVAARLTALTNSLKQRLGDAVTIHRDRSSDGYVESTHLDPRREDACPTSWAELGASELVLQVGEGGRWELTRDLEAVELIERIVTAVTEGRVTEVFGPSRSQVTVTLEDGTSKNSTGYQGLPGLVPSPGWRHRGRSVAYEPYE